MSSIKYLQERRSAIENEYEKCLSRGLHAAESARIARRKIAHMRCTHVMQTSFDTAGALAKMLDAANNRKLSTKSSGRA